MSFKSILGNLDFLSTLKEMGSGSSGSPTELSYFCLYIKIFTPMTTVLFKELLYTTTKCMINNNSFILAEIGHVGHFCL